MRSILLLLILFTFTATMAYTQNSWLHLSSKTGDLEAPGISTQQTASQILDINNDGLNDFVIGARKVAPCMVWFERTASGWNRHVLDDSLLPIEAGGTYHDIDGDGDLDIVMGEDASGNHVYWWENPYPNYQDGVNWKRYVIKDTGGNKHHDQIFGDFDGDGSDELVIWNQRGKRLLIADIPSNPKTTQPWDLHEIYTWDEGKEHEGIAKADINGDGKLDIVGGGRWFEHKDGKDFTAHIIDAEQRFTRAVAGQLIEGGRPEVVFVPGDADGPIYWYEWNDNQWNRHQLLDREVIHGHSIGMDDINLDGHLDIFNAEMHTPGHQENAEMWIHFGDGEGNFDSQVISRGIGNHESRVADLDGDGDFDILGKPYTWDTPRVDVWINPSKKLSLHQWKRHVIDEEKPWRAVFISSADINQDGHNDIATGGWWYQNPGDINQDWKRNVIGEPLRNLALIEDYDHDGDPDILGTQGKASSANADFVWAKNDGKGNFLIKDNITKAKGDFLQGVLMAPLENGQTQIAMSWHQANQGIQLFTLPKNPSTETWTWKKISDISQDECLSTGDIDGDGDNDLSMGTKWLENKNGDWVVHDLSQVKGDPDRNRLADMNNDGKLDSVVGYEAINVPGKLCWYRQPSDVNNTNWDEIIIGMVHGPMSVDVADLDGDGDTDVVVGEHLMTYPQDARLYVFENADGKGTTWNQHLVSKGDEHHDGARLTDIDGDGDLDIISIGWSHGRVVLYENKAIDN